MAEVDISHPSANLGILEGTPQCMQHGGGTKGARSWDYATLLCRGASPSAWASRPIWPGTERLIPPLTMPPILDLLALFADDGVAMGP